MSEKFLRFIQYSTRVYNCDSTGIINYVFMPFYNSVKAGGPLDRLGLGYKPQLAPHQRLPLVLHVGDVVKVDEEGLSGDDAVALEVVENGANGKQRGSEGQHGPRTHPTTLLRTHIQHVLRAPAL